jgi:hypothetical protein
MRLFNAIASSFHRSIRLPLRRRATHRSSFIFRALGLAEPITNPLSDSRPPSPLRREIASMKRWKNDRFDGRKVIDPAGSVGQPLFAAAQMLMERSTRWPDRIGATANVVRIYEVRTLQQTPSISSQFGDVIRWEYASFDGKSGIMIAFELFRRDASVNIEFLFLKRLVS